MNREEGRYGIARVEALPKRGNENYLYVIIGDASGTVYRFTRQGQYEVVPLSEGAAGGTDDQTASEVAFTPVAGLASTDVQSAIAEVQGNIVAGGSDDQTAAEVPVTPAGNLGSANVQDALVELQGDIDAAGDASGVSVTPTGNLSSTNVQSALQELQADIDGVAAASTDDQIAAEVPVTPSGNLTSTDVQSALNELQGDIDAAGDAANVSVTPSGNLTSTDVQSALTEIQTELDTVAAQAAAGSDDQIASEVPVTPIGNLTSVNVQAALIELQGDIDGIAATDDQTAAEVPFTATGNTTSTNVQDAIVEIQSELDTVAAQAAAATDDQTAAEVPVTPSGNLAATDVQAALLELQGDIDGIAGTDDQTAAEVPFTATGNTTSTNVQDAIVEIQSELDTVAAQAAAATDDQTAAEVPFTPAGGIAATDVQAAIVEVQANVAAGTDDQTASEVPFTATGNTTSTNVQDAIVEIQSELDAVAAASTDDQTAAEVSIADAGALYTGTDVETALQEAGSDIADLRTLTGTADGDTGLGIFSGATIADNASIKDALQSLETSLEAGTGTDDQTAAEVPFTATGNTTSTNVQDAIVEIQSELDAVAAASTDDQTAAEVAVTPAGNLAATDVQAALQELQGDIDAIVGTDDQTAAEVPIADTGALFTGTDVEAALQEVGQDAADLRALSGTADGDTNLGTFTGSTIADGATLKAAMQSLESAIESNDADLAALANGMTYQGNWDASAGTFPGAGAAQTGAFYTVSVGGTVDGVVFNAGDRLIATVDNASTTTFAANWTQLDATDSVTSVDGNTGNITAAQIKTSYESNADTNAFTDAEQTKLGFISVTQAVDLDALEQDVADITTLSGVASNATDLGTFTGSTIADSQDIKSALQSLETAVESSGNIGGTIADNQVAIGNGADSLDGSANLTFDGTILSLTGNLSASGISSEAAFTNIPSRLSVVNPSFGGTRLGDSALQTPSLDVQSINFKDASQATAQAMFFSAVGGGDGYVTTLKNFVDDVNVISIAGLEASAFGAAGRQVESTIGLRNDFSGGEFRVFDTFNNDYDTATAVAEAQGWVAIHGGGATAKPIGLYRYDTTTYSPIFIADASNTVTFSQVTKGVDGVAAEDFVTKAQLDAVSAAATDDQTAAEVPFTPTGNTLATDVQAAIVEIQTELDTVIASGGGDLISTNNLSDVADAAAALGNLNGVSTNTAQTITAVKTFTQVTKGIDGVAAEDFVTKSQLDAISGATNLAYTAAATQGTVTSDTGTDAVLPLADGTNAGLLSPADFTKLGFIGVTQVVDLDAIETQQGNLVTLSGVAANSTDLGTFTGTTITDNVTTKAALQELETAIEAIVAFDEAGSYTLTGAWDFDGSAVFSNGFTIDGPLGSNPWIITEDSLNTLVFSNDGSTRYSMRASGNALIDSDIVNKGYLDGVNSTLFGITAGDTNLGTFTGTTITDNSSVKTALQELESAVELGSGGDFLADGSVAMTGTLNAGNQQIDNVNRLDWIDSADTNQKILSIFQNISNGLQTNRVFTFTRFGGGETFGFDMTQNKWIFTQLDLPTSQTGTGLVTVDRDGALQRGGAITEQVEFSAPVVTNPGTLTSVAGVVDWTGAESAFYELTLTEDTTWNNPSGPVNNSAVRVRIRQDGTGLHTLTFGSAFKFPGGVAPAITLDPNAVDYLTIVVDGTDLHCVEVQNFL